VTTTTTTVAAPITVVAAPITTSNTTNMAPAGAGALTGAGAGAAAGALNPAPSSRPGLLVVNLRGCAAPARAAKDTTRRPATGRAQVRLPRDTTLVVRVNGRRVSTLQLDGGRGPAAKPLPLRLTLRRDGTLTVRRPSGQVLLTQGCAAN
jgi:hypothetical protein